MTCKRNLKSGIKIARRNINNLILADDTNLMAEGEEELKSLLMKMKEESGKSWFKNQIFKKPRSWHPVPLFHGKQMGKNGNSERLYFLGL